MKLSYQVVYVLNFVVCVLAMKVAGWMLWHPKDKTSLKSFVLSPYISPRSLLHTSRQRLRPLIRLVLCGSLSLFCILLTKEFFGKLSYWEVVIFSPTFYFLIEAMGALGQVLFFKNAKLPIHKSPLSSVSLSHFWGRDWNQWVQDWLRQITRTLGKGRHIKRIVLVFLISGFFHELMCNLPYWLVFRKSYFGTMLVYFLIQALALWIDKRFMKHFSGKVRRAYLWLAVTLPSPLFINVPLLTFLGLKHE